MTDIENWELKMKIIIINLFFVCDDVAEVPHAKDVVDAVNVVEVPNLLSDQGKPHRYYLWKK